MDEEDTDLKKWFSTNCSVNKEGGKCLAFKKKLINSSTLICFMFEFDYFTGS